MNNLINSWGQTKCSNSQTDKLNSDGFSLGTPGDPDLDHAVSYGFDTAGRLNEVSGAGKTFTYGFTTNSSHLIATVTGPADILVTNTWETDRDVLSVKENEVDAATVSHYTYAVNNLVIGVSPRYLTFSLS